MAIFAVVEYFDLRERIGAGLFAHAVAHPVRVLAPEQAEEARGTGADFGDGRARLCGFVVDARCRGGRGPPHPRYRMNRST